jgi:hypothetical protein
MAKKPSSTKSTSTSYKKKGKKRRPGIHSKKNSSSLKSSKNYKKSYRSQGK